MIILFPLYDGVFAKFRKATISFVMFVHLSVRMEQNGSNCKYFHYIWYGIIFRKCVEKIKVSVNLTRIMGTLHEDQYLFFIISPSFLIRIRNVSDKFSREKQNTHFMYVTLFRKWFRLWENVEIYCRWQYDAWALYSYARYLSLQRQFPNI
jgi:hypothetical protein